MKFMIPCDEANHVCDKTQYNEASLWEMIKLNLHLMYCKACRSYTKNNAKLTKTLKQGDVEILEESYKDAMKKDFEKALKEASNKK